MDETIILEERSQAQFKKMTQTPIPRLIVKLSIPTIASMLVMSIYSLADTFFVSILGTSAGGAVGVVFSIMAIIQAFGFMLGMGSGSLVSRRLGEKNREEASTYTASAFYLGIVIGLLITVFGLVFIDPLMLAIGSTETILPYARDYAMFVLPGAPIMCMSIVMNNTLRAEGKAVLAMTGMMFGTILNIGLDPLFIFTFNMGIAGAAIATLLGQVISFFIMLSFFITKRSQMSLHPRYIAKEFRYYFDILKVGVPALCRQGIASLSNIALNVNAAAYGDAAVAAATITGRLFMFIFSVMLGIGQGFQPVAGYNYGAKLYKRVRSAFWFTVIAGFCMMVVLSTLGFVFAEPIMRAFRADDRDVIEIGGLMMRLQCAAMLFVPLSSGASMLFQSTGRAGKAIFMSVCRQGIFFLPLIYVLPRFFGLLGVQMALPIADVLTAIATVVVLFPYLAQLKREESIQ